MGMQSLSSMLWRERQLLELLLFKLEVEQLLLTSGHTRWLSHATDEVEAVLEQIRATELGHAVESDAVAAQLGIPAGSTLAQLAAAAPTPWAGLLSEHRDAFIDLTGQIERLAADNRTLLTASHRAAQETLMAVTQAVQTYDANGHAGSPTGSASLLDETL